MSFFRKLNDIDAFVFDLDGVLTDGSVLASPDGELLRTFNIRDGYAVQQALQQGYHVALISGARSSSAAARLASLGLRDIYMEVADKKEALDKYLAEKGLRPGRVLYMGDDLPDYDAMQLVGLPACPADAAEEIREICLYTSPFNGGRGCVRDIIEKVLKVQGKWMQGKGFVW